MSSIQARVCSRCSGASWMKPSRRTLMEEKVYASCLRQCHSGAGSASMLASIRSRSASSSSKMMCSVTHAPSPVQRHRVVDAVETRREAPSGVAEVLHGAVREARPPQLGDQRLEEVAVALDQHVRTGVPGEDVEGQLAHRVFLRDEFQSHAEFLAEQVEVLGEPGREVPPLVRPAAADGGALRLLVGSWFG